MKKNSQMPGKTNWPVTILLILGCITIFFPLYMAVIIAFKKPSEMTNQLHLRQRQLAEGSGHDAAFHGGGHVLPCLEQEAP